MSDHAYAVEWQLTNQVIPPNTCPTIDTVVGGVRSALKMAENRRRYDEVADLQAVLGDIAWELSGVEAEIETVREHNATLRDLGKAWYSLANEGLALLVKLEKRLTAVEAERDRAERILAVLREPSEAVVDAAVGAVERNWMWLADVIRKSGVIAPAIAAAVAAAEREVDA